MNPTGDLLNRRQLFEELGISDSNERRKRKQGGSDWPPHLCIGNKVFYRRDSVTAWLLRQEAICHLDDATTTALHPLRQSDLLTNSGVSERA